MTKEGTSFNKKEAQEVLLIIKDILNNKENIIDNSLLDNLKKYVNKHKLDLIITSREKIIFTCGSKVEKYLNYSVSENLRGCINEESLSTMRSSRLEISDGNFIKGLYYYIPVKNNDINIGSIIWIYNKRNREKAGELLLSL